MIMAVGYQRPCCSDSSLTFSSQSLVLGWPGPPSGVYKRTPYVASFAQPPMLICRPALSGSTKPAAQKTSVLTCIVLQALLKSLTCVTSSSYAPVPLLAGDVPNFSTKVTLLLMPIVVISGMTGPPIKNS